MHWPHRLHPCPATPCRVPRSSEGHTAGSNGGGLGSGGTPGGALRWGSWGALRPLGRGSSGLSLSPVRRDPGTEGCRGVQPRRGGGRSRVANGRGCPRRGVAGAAATQAWGQLRVVAVSPLQLGLLDLGCSFSLQVLRLQSSPPETKNPTNLGPQRMGRNWSHGACVAPRLLTPAPSCHALRAAPEDRTGQVEGPACGLRAPSNPAQKP